MRIAEEWSSKGRKLWDKIRLTGLLRKFTQLLLAGGLDLRGLVSFRGMAAGHVPQARTAHPDKESEGELAIPLVSGGNAIDSGAVASTSHAHI